MDQRRHSEWCLGQAQRCAITALNALLVPTAHGKADAMLYLGLAMLRIAESDPDERALNVAEECLRTVADASV
jgi:hypothetical protein